jgi:hypothetical protein
MVIAGTLEGVVDARVSFHYDLAGDVLYLCLIDHAEGSAIGEDTPDDLVLFRDEKTDEVVGLDVISWWKRFGEGTPRDSLREITRRIEPMAERLLTEAQARCAS